MTPQQIEAMKLALEALENISSFQNHTSGDSSDADKAITAIKEALAETQYWSEKYRLIVQKEFEATPPRRTEQEPFCLHWEDRWGCNHYADPKEPHPVNAKPLYTTPPQRKPLTDKAITRVIDRLPKKMKGFMVDWDLYIFTRAIEAAHGIKENT